MLQFAFLPVSWEVGGLVHRGVPSGGDTYCVRACIEANSATSAVKATLDPTQLGWRIVSAGPRSDKSVIGTTVLLRADPSELLGGYGLFGLQLLILEIGAIAEQITLLAGASGLNVAWCPGDLGVVDGDSVFIRLRILDDGALADEARSSRDYFGPELRAMPTVVTDTLREFVEPECRNDHDLSRPTSLDPFSATLARTSGPPDDGTGPHHPIDVEGLLAGLAAFGGWDTCLEVVHIDWATGDAHRLAASSVEPLRVGINERVGRSSPRTGSGSATLLISMATPDMCGWSTYRHAMMASGALMQRMCLAAAAIGCWARPKRQVPDRVMNLLMPLGRYVALQVDLGKRVPSTIYAL